MCKCVCMCNVNVLCTYNIHGCMRFLCVCFVCVCVCVCNWPYIISLGVVALQAFSDYSFHHFLLFSKANSKHVIYTW